MPKKFPVSLPSAHQRRRIFKLVLRGTKLDDENFNLDYLVRVSAGMSGSDIKEACRDAAMGPVREYIKEKKRLGTLGKAGVNPEEVRGVRTSDFFGSKASGVLTPAAAATPKGADGQVESLDTSEVSDEEEVFAESSKG
jgi:SpoVK/Ycf46/Vps4 family AAA+-type ATPase